MEEITVGELLSFIESETDGIALVYISDSEGELHCVSGFTYDFVDETVRFDSSSQFPASRPDTMTATALANAISPLPERYVLTTQEAYGQRDSNIIGCVFIDELDDMQSGTYLVFD